MQEPIKIFVITAEKKLGNIRFHKRLRLARTRCAVSILQQPFAFMTRITLFFTRMIGLFLRRFNFLTMQFIINHLFYFIRFRQNLIHGKFNKWKIITFNIII
jgi:hypothetical protein